MGKMLFDPRLRALRRDRAARLGPETFLFERAFDDILDRLQLVRRGFGRALLIGCPDPGWGGRLEGICDRVDIVDPGPLFARQAGGRCAEEDRLEAAPGTYDLCVAIGTLESVNDLPEALLRIRFALKPDSLLIGAMSGGNMLPRLREAMRAADRETGVASPHVHPRIDPSSLAGLLQAAGFVMPVVDLDQVDVAYRSFAALVRDLRRMGGTNLLIDRPRKPLGRRSLAAAAAQFASAADAEGRTVERFDLLHFAAWTAASEPPVPRPHSNR